MLCVKKAARSAWKLFWKRALLCAFLSALLALALFAPLRGVPSSSPARQAFFLGAAEAGGTGQASASAAAAGVSKASAEASSSSSNGGGLSDGSSGTGPQTAKSLQGASSTASKSGASNDSESLKKEIAATEAELAAQLLKAHAELVAKAGTSDPQVSALENKVLSAAAGAASAASEANNNPKNGGGNAAMLDVREIKKLVSFLKAEDLRLKSVLESEAADPLLPEGAPSGLEASIAALESTTLKLEKLPLTSPADAASADGAESTASSGEASECSVDEMSSSLPRQEVRTFLRGAGRGRLSLARVREGPLAGFFVKTPCADFVSLGIGVGEGSPRHFVVAFVCLEFESQGMAPHTGGEATQRGL